MSLVEDKRHKLIGRALEFTTGEKHTVELSTEIIPIIVVPGIMGTRLRNAKSGDLMWDPDDAMFMLGLGMVWTTAKKKQKIVLGPKRVLAQARPDETDAKHNAEFFAKKFPTAVKRGWGSLAWAFYGRLLETLTTRTWRMKGVRHPIYACGYDWRDTNRNAGKLLANKIDQALADWPAAEKVIVITHSMGGIVTRSAMFIHNAAAKVAGVVHCVQPVTGAAAAWWRMRSGFPRGAGVKGKVVPWILGTDSLEVTALLANMPGGMELLPSKHYVAGDGRKDWLRIHGTDGREKFALPREGDPYREIYARPEGAYWCINPSFITGGRRADTEEVAERWEAYLGRLGKAGRLHDELHGKQHEQSHHLVGTGGHTVDRLVFRESSRDRPVPHPKHPPPPLYSHRGEYWSYMDLQPGATSTAFVALDGPMGDGDETVPVASGAALKSGSKSCKGYDGAVHDACFGNDAFLEGTLQAVEAIVSEVVKN